MAARAEPDAGAPSINQESMSIEQLILIALATFISEDLTCIATGLLVTQGKVSFIPGTLACLLGIFIGDLLQARVPGMKLTFPCVTSSPVAMQVRSSLMN